MVKGFLMHASQDAARRPAAAEIIQCLRVGRPPYRFSGHRLAHDQVALDDGVLLFIELWQRRRGGYTLAFSRWTGEGWSPDACNVTTIEAAMDAVENICATQTPSGPGLSSEQDSPLIDQISKVALLQNQIERFRHLAGRTLDVWIDL